MLLFKTMGSIREENMEDLNLSPKKGKEQVPAYFHPPWQSSEVHSIIGKISNESTKLSCLSSVCQECFPKIYFEHFLNIWKIKNERAVI